MGNSITLLVPKIALSSDEGVVPKENTGGGTECCVGGIIAREKGNTVSTKVT